MSDIWSWPALAGVSAASLPHFLAVERAVWGKVHGARSDFRWIAASRGFAVRGRGLERELAVGIEDRPVRFPFWRAAPGLHVAGSGYPSRARDASGRGGALEKQLLAWRAEHSVPAGAAALLLLPRAAELDDGAWWGRAAPAAWDADPRFVLDLGGPLEVPVSERLLAEAAARGIADLRARLVPDGGAALAEVFGALLAGRRPVLCPLGDQPLEPEALAALLLPLDRERADGLSLAGWLPSSRPPRADLGGSWDVVVHAGGRSRTAEATATDPRTRAMAAALLAGDPSLLGGSPALDRPAARPAPAAADDPRRRDARELPPAEEPVTPDLPPLPRAPELAEPPAGAGAGWRILYDFARDPHRFWLDPQELAPYLREPAGENEEAVQTALSWLRTLASSRPPSAPAGDQHRAKEDLLWAGILALSPTPLTVERLGALRSGLVPPLLYLMALHPESWSYISGALGMERATRLLEQSRRQSAPELHFRIERRLPAYVDPPVALEEPWEPGSGP